MEVVPVPFLKAIPGGQLTKHCNLEAYKYLMNTWNALPKPYRHRVHNNTLAAVKQRILDADTAVPTAPVSTEPAHVDAKLLEEFLKSTAPLEEPKIGSTNQNCDMPGDIDAYEGFVAYNDGESFDFVGEAEPSVPHEEPDDADDVRSMSRRRKPSEHQFAYENDAAGSDGENEVDLPAGEEDLHGLDDQYEDATQGEEHIQA